MGFHKIGFIGLGLIGGSIAKKLKAIHPDIHIIASAGHVETIREAYELGIIDNRELLPLTAFSECDYIFLCAPVQKNISYLAELKDIIKKDCYITDVGSTKTEIHEEISRLGMEANFIGGHPMAGSEKTGIANANEYLLENAYYIITPTTVTPQKELDNFRSFVTSLGAIPLVLDYKTHDYATASISHLPHVIAFALVNLIQRIDDENDTMKTIAAGGFRDITRIASSSPVMWQNIFLSNRKPVLNLIDQYMDEISHLRTLIEQADSDAMIEYFSSARDYRDSITVPGKAHAVVYEIYLDLIDEAGGIAAIATILALKGISIKNIGIINNREFEDGVLRIEFYDQESLDLAVALLTERNYTLYKR